MLMLANALPPVLLAHTVNSVVVILTVGVPEIVPLSKIKPVGKPGLISQVSIRSSGVYTGTISVINVLRMNV